MNWEYLSHQHLVGFEHYQYSSVDTNPISVYIMHPFWERIVLLFPKWVAPNVLTFVGFLFTAGACLMLSIYDYEFYASSSDHPEYSPVPRWIFMAAAVSIFIAYTLDGIDGKQARRTRSSGPLGELFDHGLDSWTAVLIPTCLYSVFGRTDYSVAPVRFYFVCWNVFITFYMSHWEKYNTGVLFLPWGYDLSMLATTGVFIITYLFGHEWWKFKVFEGVATGHVLELLFYFSSVGSSLPVVFWNIYKSYQDRTGKMRSFWEANRPLVPVFVFLFICAIWVYYSPSDIISRDPRAFYLTSGTIFSNICVNYQRRWRSLRDSYTRELNIKLKHKSGSGRPERKKYIYFNQLAFIRSSVKKRKTSLSLVDGMCNNTNTLTEEPEFDDLPNTSVGPKEHQLPEERRTTQSSIIDIRPPTVTSRKRKCEDLLVTELKVLQEKLKRLSEKTVKTPKLATEVEEDEDKIYCHY